MVVDRDKGRSPGEIISFERGPLLKDSSRVAMKTTTPGQMTVNNLLASEEDEDIGTLAEKNTIANLL